MAAETEQFNVRVTEHTFEAIKATVYLRRFKSPQQLLGPLVERLGAELADAPAIATVMRLREEEKPRPDNVMKLQDRRGSRKPR